MPAHPATAPGKKDEKRGVGLSGFPVLLFGLFVVRPCRDHYSRLGS
jgi:hypothetical protein